MARVVDLRGLECPEPLLKATRIVLTMPPGSSAVFLVDNEVCAENIRLLVSSSLGSASVRRRNGYFEVSVSRGLIL